MTKSEERRLREHYAREARHRWVAFPLALVGTLEAIMELQGLTAGKKLKQMQWAMDAYNDALKEASSNAESMPD